MLVVTRSVNPLRLPTGAQVLAARGLAVPRECREPDDYSAFFRALGLAECRRRRRPGERGLLVRALRTESKTQMAA